MKRAALYSSASRTRAAATAVAVPSAPPPRRLRTLLRGYQRPLLAFVAIAALLAIVMLAGHGAESPALITQDDIDRAVRLSIEKKPLPSKAAKAFEVIRPSVVRVVGLDHPGASDSLAKPPGKARNPEAKSAGENTSIGTGVVITEAGAILTNLHVVSGAKRIQLRFSDGSESEAMIKGVDADNDLAVLQAKTLPDDLQPATLISTGDLKPGDEVVAVGYPFGFGPSVSAGVVSGLKREFRSADGTQALGNLIQFDAAANPGNSGGPLVNMEGEVLGIVTAILNPVQQHFFVGLGFAVPIENAAMAVGVSPF
jgi:S1-C subfamily serine protease